MKFLQACGFGVMIAAVTAGSLFMLIAFYTGGASVNIRDPRHKEGDKIAMSVVTKPWFWIVPSIAGMGTTIALLVEEARLQRRRESPPDPFDFYNWRR